jgi:uroporphyrinogen decarboxylase
MTSRERLLAACRHREPDRVPYDLASTQVTGISVYAYKNLIDYMGIEDDHPEICDHIQQICLPKESILQEFGVDTRGLWPVTNHTGPFDDEEQGDYLHHVDEWGFDYRIHKTRGLWYDLCRHPLPQETATLQDVSAYTFPNGGDTARVEGLREQAKRYRQQGYAVVLKSVCAGLLEVAIRIRGMENALTDLLINKPVMGKILDGILEVKLDYWQTALAELADVVDIVAEGDDFGTQLSPLISPETYREMIRPRQIEMIQSMKKWARDSYVFFHSCGNIRPFLPDFIDMGIDIINPVHITAEGMDPVKLKRDFGKDVVFWGGGIDTQDVLPHAKPQQIRDHVKKNIDALAPGGGFVFNTIHNIQADVPPENILAMIETLQDYGRY